MDKYRYKISITADVEAYDPSDAWDALQDAFGLGDAMGITVVDCEYEEVNAKRKMV
jgi:hypothetical protein